MRVAMGYAPRVVIFACNWCSYAAIDLAGTSRMRYPVNFSVIRLMCSGRVDPQFVVEAFKRGADGVIVAGCHPGDCHYVDGNMKTLRRTTMLRSMLADLGIEPKRLRLEWISASEAKRFVQVVEDILPPDMGQLYSFDPFVERYDDGGVGIKFVVTRVIHRRYEMVDPIELEWAAYKRMNFWDKLRYLFK